MSSRTPILSDKDVNAPASNNPQQAIGDGETKGDIKSMEYHRQVLQSKLQNGPQSTCISPSDNIMSPCTAKLSAYRNKQVGLKAKPKSLFAKTSSKNLNSSGPMFGDKSTESEIGSSEEGKRS